MSRRAKAPELDRPLLVSIGYSSCHWCHVMERESFEDPETARLMNEHFVCVKVDREERPDVDAIYMEAVQGMTGQGGWPLTVFDPEGVLLDGGTYFLRAAPGLPSFAMVIEAVIQSSATQRERIRESSGRIRAQLGAAGRLEPPTSHSPSRSWPMSEEPAPVRRHAPRRLRRGAEVPSSGGASSCCSPAAATTSSR